MTVGSRLVCLEDHFDQGPTDQKDRTGWQWSEGGARWWATQPEGQGGGQPRSTGVQSIQSHSAWDVLLRVKRNGAENGAGPCGKGLIWCTEEFGLYSKLSRARLLLVFLSELGHRCLHSPFHLLCSKQYTRSWPCDRDSLALHRFPGKLWFGPRVLGHFPSHSWTPQRRVSSPWLLAVYCWVFQSLVCPLYNLTVHSYWK